MDHVKCTIVDTRRTEMKVPRVDAVGKLATDLFGHEGYDIRQPRYIAVAGQDGLGYFDFKSPRGRQFSVDHRVARLA